MHPSGKQLREITELIEAGKLDQLLIRCSTLKKLKKPLNTLKVEEQKAKL